MQPLYQFNVKQIFLRILLRPHSLGNDRKSNISEKAPKSPYRILAKQGNAFARAFAKPKKINFSMSLKRPVSDAISKIPDFGVVRQGFCWHAQDSDIKNSMSENSNFRPLQGVIHAWDAIWDGSGKVEKWAFDLLNFDIAKIARGKIFM